MSKAHQTRQRIENYDRMRRELGNANTLVSASTNIRRKFSGKRNLAQNEDIPHQQIHNALINRLSINDSVLSAATVRCSVCHLRKSFTEFPLVINEPKETEVVVKDDKENCHVHPNSSVIDREMLLHLLNNKDEAVERLLGENRRLQELNSSNAEQNRLKDLIIKNLTDRVSELSAEVSELHGAIKAFSGSHSQSAERIAELNAIYADEKARLQVSVIQLQEQCLRLTALSEDNNGLLAGERAARAAQEDSYQQLVGELRDQIASLHAEVAASRLSLEAHEEGFEAERRGLRGQVDRLQRQLSAAQEALRHAEGQRVSGDIVREQQELIRELKDELTEVKRKDYRHQIAIQQLRAELDESWERHRLEGAGTDTIFQLRALLDERRRAEIDQAELVRLLQHQLALHPHTLPYRDQFKGSNSAVGSNLSQVLKKDLDEFKKTQFEKKIHYQQQLQQL